MKKVEKAHSTEKRRTMMKVISVICAISVLALGVTDIVFTCVGLTFPRPLNYLLWPLCAINAGFLLKYAKKNG